MNLDCRVPRDRSLKSLLRRIDEDPVHDHYTPCELAPLLARHYVSIFVTGNGIALLEITDEGYASIEGASK